MKIVCGKYWYKLEKLKSVRTELMNCTNSNIVNSVPAINCVSSNTLFLNKTVSANHYNNLGNKTE